VKYAIIADLHANLEALVAVLASIALDRVDHVVCLGDIVGYNADPEACVKLVKDSGIRSIAGNHDRAAVGTKDTRHFGGPAKHAIEWTKTQLSADSRSYLAALPTTLLVDDEFFLVHGALHPEPNDDLHLSNATRVAASLSALVTGRFGARICFFGHSHRPAIYEQRAGRIRQIDAMSAVLLPEAHYLVNPGSVGQSRDGDPRAAYALFDAEHGALELRRVRYDLATAQRRSRERGLLAPDGSSARASHWLQACIDDGRDAILRQARRLIPGGH
jgi:predicted phosphodiesterase